jgi:hypothetical protein
MNILYSLFERVMCVIQKNTMNAGFIAACINEGMFLPSFLIARFDAVSV